VLVSPAVTRLAVPPVPPATLVLEGEQDDVVPLAAILDWARPLNQPVTVVPGTGHFFHGQLAVLRELVRRHLQQAAASA
jgi:alpha/beta superfamily hydrolase